MPALSESSEFQDKVDSLLAGCFSLQKLYGRKAESAEQVAAINAMFHSLLGKYPGEKVIRALETWLERSQEFPTPADIINLIRRNGRPPLKESDIIAIRKKDGQDRTSEEWGLLKDWENQQMQGWPEDDGEEKQKYLLQENQKLREQNIELKRKVSELSISLKNVMVAKRMAPPGDALQRTIDHMKATGAPQEDIDALLNGGI